MIVRAELRSLFCGYELGEIEGDRGASVTSLLFPAVDEGEQLQIESSGRIPCPRCHSRIIPQGLRRVFYAVDPTTVFEEDLGEETGVCRAS